MINVAFVSVGQMTAQIKDIKSPIAVNIGKPLSMIADIGLIGPKGEKGDFGDLNDASINNLGDVQLTNPQNGDTLIYNNNKFINQHIETITDGGNF